MPHGHRTVLRSATAASTRPVRAAPRDTVSIYAIYAICAICAVAHKLLSRPLARIRNLRLPQPGILPLAV